jgi:hypothetical protein
MNIYT